MHYDVELDTRGMLCPIPILKTRYAIEPLQSGQVLRVLSTDAGSLRDMEAFARQTEHELLETVVEGGEYAFYLRRG